MEISEGFAPAAGRTLYITDLDGTFLNSDKQISDYSRAAVGRLLRRGVRFTVATARPASSVERLLRGLALETPVALMNGAAVYDLAAGRYLKTESIPAARMAQVVEVLKSFGMTGFLYVIADGGLELYYENLDTPALRQYHDERAVNYCRRISRAESFYGVIPAEGTVYFVLPGARSSLEPVHARLENIGGIGRLLYESIYTPDLWYLEIFSDTASKSNAVEFIRRYAGCSRSVGFGDNYNDISLLRACDEGYAVANAVEELKRIATDVIGGNDGDGVARWLEEHA